MVIGGITEAAGPSQPRAGSVSAAELLTAVAYFQNHHERAL
jgi:hypothetical protein